MHIFMIRSYFGCLVALSPFRISISETIITDYVRYLPNYGYIRISDRSQIILNLISKKSGIIFFNYQYRKVDIHGIGKNK